MPLVMGDLYVALRSANVPEDKAMAAAAEVASVMRRSGTASAMGGLRILKWMLAANVVLAAIGLLAV